MSSGPSAAALVIDRLTVDGVRNLKHTEILPEPGINLITGANGAGKTSLLEAIYILGRGRSFRSRRSHDWMTRGEPLARIVARTVNQAKQTQQTLGLERDRQGWQARIDGRAVNSFAQLSQRLPLVMFEPTTHELISGGPEQRRAFLDWGVFHVEPDYVASWRRYQRSLRQRNAALREQAQLSVIQSLTPGITAAAEQLDQQRLRFFGQLQQAYTVLHQQLEPDVPQAELMYQRGWNTEQSLAELLEAELGRDREAGYTRHGPHRADISLLHEQRQLRGWLSRGQQKLLALLLLLSQQQTWKSASGRAPVILLDDLYSELDAAHSEKVLSLLQLSDAQTWITSTNQPVSDGLSAAATFHVEQGRIQPAG